MNDQATGLIIGLKDSPTLDSGSTGPRRVERERTQWENATRLGRERLTQLAREAGLPQGKVGEAGNAQLLRFEQPLRGDALANAVRRARLHPDVAWVEPDVLVPRLAVPNDTYFAAPVVQWHLQTPGAGNVAGLNMSAAWDNTTGTATGVVAVVDSGILFDHPDLPTRASGRMLQGRDMVSELSIANDGDGRDGDPSDPGDWLSAAEEAAPQSVYRGCEVTDSSWHGTFIAGQIAAATNNARGVAGLNWNSKILPVRVSGKCGARLSDLLDGMRWAAGLPVSGQPANLNPAKVINLSFGGDRSCASSPGYQSTIDAVTNAGSLIVVASGNSDQTLTRPADCRRVMTVASVRRDGAKANYSSFGSNVALSAPGGSYEPPVPHTDTLLLSTGHSSTTAPDLVNFAYEFKQGTSFAAPQAAGVASLMLSINPSLSPRQLIDRMKAGVRPHVALGGLPACGTPGDRSCNCSTTTCGAGMLDANTSVQLATGPAVVIRPLVTVEPGAMITLDGSQSVPIPGRTIDPASYRWVQVSGPTVTISADRTAVAKATLVTEASYEFSLRIADDQGRTGEDSVVVIAAMPPPPAGSGGGGGGGSTGQLWGLSLWAWVLALAISQRRRLLRR
ncbi:S8 family peptidase [Hydrogenophaga sp.]|uniref:S8 family peptidase n=1 Tax=Hydrogenophaga sp. TaxID=1904254 RepID=UPI0027192F8D|nr:S8 family serine peptidase [Hydrogenophaga sp.]MDO9438969.1 S8 family serine peptidase [Hydrogenophaga sp.]